jgi:hypothetical protein
MMNPFTSSGRGTFKKRITKSAEMGAFGNFFCTSRVPRRHTMRFWLRPPAENRKELAGV